jgi:hyperosmotically inducible protein
MRVRSWIGALVLGVALAPLPALAQAAKVDDSAIKARVETRLKASASLKHDDIKVEAENGVVTLTGTVGSRAESARAARLAKVAGVTRVENKLDIKSDTAATTGKEPGLMHKAADQTDKVIDKTVDLSKEGASKTVDASKKVASKTKDVATSAGDAITDTWILTKVKANFVGEDALKGSDINVDVDNHVVTLKGTVPSAAGRARAKEIARTTTGVKRVIDNLTIAPAK